jgi:hypothetical protein
MSLNLDIDSLPPEQVKAAITRLEAVKAQRAAEKKLAHYRPYPKQVAFHEAGARHRELTSGFVLRKFFMISTAQMAALSRSRKKFPQISKTRS